ncbi:MAG: hypothetical protein A2089_03800 [Elusimicrobia bacterium GWD2_63_28]|nr:MAG: hypothetical protein A2089_03800 [Elusimicrobia bacterium GWD2_63_28]
MDSQEIHYKPAPQEKSLVARLFSDKIQRQRLSVTEIINLINERQAMLNRNVKTLDYQLCQIGGLKSTFDTIHYTADLGALIKDKIGLEKSVTELEMKKADEYKQCWKDISTLRKDLLDGLVEYMALQKKAELLSPSYREYDKTSPYPPKPTYS